MKPIFYPLFFVMTLNIDNSKLIRLILKIVYENAPCLNTFLTQKIAQILKINKKDKKALSDKIRWIIKKLEKYKLIVTHRIDKKTYEIIPYPQKTDQQKDIPSQRKRIDSNLFPPARNSPECPPQPTSTKQINPTIEATYALFYPRWSREHEIHREAYIKYARLEGLAGSDLEDLAGYFQLWREDISQRLLLFWSPDAHIVEITASSRFTTPAKAYQILKQAEEIFNNAFNQYDKAIFLTITLPHIFPMKLALWLLSYLIHRIKAFLRKKLGETVPHIKIIEPQKKLYPHIHIVIFGIDHLMWKQELTKYLDRHVERFLERLGENYKMTINKRADEVTVKGLNKLGRRFKTRYRNYKKKKKKYTGPINWISKVKYENGEPEFENPPRDYSGIRTEEDGEEKVKYPLWEYLKKYLTKNLKLVLNKFEDKKAERKACMRLAFYWLFRVPFYTCSPKLRPKRERPPPSGWIFLFSCREDEYYEAVERAEWLVRKWYDDNA